MIANFHKFRKKYRMAFLFSILILCLITDNRLNAQNYFNLRIDADETSSKDVCKDILALEDGYLISANYVEWENYGFWSNSFIKIDLEGNIVKRKFFTDSLISKALSYSQGGLRRSHNAEEYYNVGWKEYIINNAHLYTGLIYKINADFDTLWTRSYTDLEKPNDSDLVFNHMSLLINDEMIIAGDMRISSSNYKVLLMLVDSSGNEQWRRYYESGPYNKGINVIPTPDGGFALSCYKWVPQNNTSHNYLIKTDSLGNEQWRRYIGGLYADGPLYLANSPDSTIVGAYAYSDYSPPPPSSNSYNRIAVVKYNLLGELIFEEIHGESIINRRVTSISSSVDGGFAVSGYVVVFHDASFSYDGTLLKVTNNGETIWYRQYRHPSTTVSSYNWLQGVTYNSDGGFAAVGVIYGFHPDPIGQDVWVIKVDSMGCINFDDCWVGEKELPLPQNKTTMLRVHPNPANDRIQLDFGPDELHLPKTLQLYDGFGRLQQTVELTPGQSEADISGLAPGLYLGRVITDGRSRASFKVLVR